MSNHLSVQPLAATTGAVSWTIYDSANTDNIDDFDAVRITLTLAVAPTSAGSCLLKIDSGEGAAYDSTLRSVNAVGATSIVFENVNDIDNESKLVVTYANPDGVSITGTGTIKKARFS